ncbi:hypothetical protein C0991_009318 [Blastosporella zonata]|nr:hypothetical protein C0991_009318 [Blastosporella zonata]
MDEDPDDSVHPSIRAPKRRVDGQPKQPHADIINPDIDYVPRTGASHTQHPLQLVTQPLSASHHHHQHPISSDRLSGHMHSQSKKPRIGISPTSDIMRSRSEDSAMSGAVSPVGTGRPTRYDLGREFGGTSRYGMPHPHHVSSPHSPPSAHHRPQYTSFFPSSGSGGTHYGQGGHTPSPPNFIPLHSQADFAASAARARSASTSGSGVLPTRNVYGSYGNEGNGPTGGGGGSRGGGGGTSGDLFAAFMDAEQQARASIARRHTTTGPGVGGGGGGGSPFGIDWPVHMPTPGGHGGDGLSSKPPPHSSIDREGDRDRRTSPGSSGSASGNGSGSGAGSGADWLDFLSGTTAAGGPTG